MTTSFGRDTSCTDSLRTGRFASGVRLVAEACYRRLTTPRGKLRGGEEEANYGFDLNDLVGSTASTSDEAALPGKIESELAKDPRVESVAVTVLATRTGPATTFQIAVEVVTGAGPFTLNIGISEVSVELLGIQAGT